MDLLEQFLAGDEESLCSFSMGDLEQIVHVLSNEVQSHREQLHKTKTEVENLEAETAERSLSREVFVSRLAQTVDLQEALEEEEKTRQQLQAATHEIERLSDVRSADSCDAWETRLKEVEDLLSTCCQEEKGLLGEVEILKTSLEKSQTALGQTTAEHQTVETKLLALRNRLATQSRPAHGEAAQVLSACIQEMGLINIIAAKRSRK